ncbi:MarR family transcriptional regulator [Devosia sp. XJ19-1]|uniref:MarR family transcriptional regulator n=1 Tax=Devosia ureilytica TaxID=2952754 RepID=A0A9Q4FSG2_9HYPH|nr:MarR family transcriptional regulator [Devosia ureilytica]MCP8882838.1 MarR family transcriptional regulator [Devosia ureilytica]MCP8886794.1 MarR family transcriptional regulator [Devosia ureilytica]
MTLNRETSLGYLTNWAGRLLARELERHLALIGLTPACMPVLFALEAGEASQKVIAERASVEQATMAATLNRMERAGLITRRPNPDDGRSQLVALTTGAREKLPQVEAAARAVNTSVLEQLTPQEGEQFIALTHKVIAALLALEEPKR